MTETVLVSLLCGQLLVPLETLPRDGHVAYTVWPCSSFLVNSLAGWRIRSREHDVGVGEMILNSDRIASHMEAWNRIEDSAKVQILMRTKWMSAMQGIRVLELGSGTGIVGIALNALGANVVVTTDMPKCMCLLDSNVTSWNKVQKGGALVTSALAWERYLPGDIDRLLEGYDSDEKIIDILVACDCVYGTEHIGRSPIVAIVSDFLMSKTISRRIVIVAYESRDDDIEGSFWYQINQCQSLGHALVNICAADAGEGNEKSETTYQIHSIFKK